MVWTRSPAELPHHLLCDPCLRAACERYDFATVFALARDVDISLNAISEATGLKRDHVGKVARGAAQVTSLDGIQRIADGLKIPGSYLGLAMRPWEADSTSRTIPESPDGDDPMKRREFVRGAAAAGLAGTTLAALRARLDASLSLDHAADLDHFEGQVERYAYGYHGQSPTDVLTAMATDQAEISEALTRPLSTRDRARLSHIAGRMAGMIAIVAHDLGDQREARAWSATAARAAGDTRDTGLAAWVWAREAMVPLNYGAPASAAELAERARHVAGSQPSAAAALAAAVASRAYAALGDHERARIAVADAERLMEALTPQQAADTWTGYPRQKHLVHISQALTLLGDTRHAYEVQREALALSRSPSLMTRALLAIDRATCHFHDGDPETAALMAAQAYGELPASYRSGLTRERAAALLRALPAQTRSRDQLRDALAA